MRTFLSPILVLALVVSACSSGGDEELGRVDDMAVTMSDVDALYDADSIPVDDAFRQTLFRLLALQVIENALQADFAATVDEAEVEARFLDFKTQIETQGLTVADALGIPDASEEMLRFNARLQVVLDTVVRRLLSDEAFLAEFTADEAAITTVCAAHILVGTEEEALAVKDRLDGGEDFATVAGELSLDPGSGAQGGDLGCASPSSYVEPFAEATLDAPVGEVVGPVESQFGFHLIRVDSREAPTLEEIRAAPEQFVPQQVAEREFQEWFDAKIAEANVSVAEEYGTWTSGGILPPAEG